MAQAHADAVSAADEGAIVQAAAAALRNRRPLKNARLKEAADVLQAGRAGEAERLLSKYLEHHPDDGGALLLLAETALTLGRTGQALALLRRALTAAPDYEAARFVYASTLYRINELDLSLAELARLLAADPHNLLFLDMKAAALEAMGRHHDAMVCRRQMAEDHPDSSGLRVKYAKALRGVGRRDDAIDALRSAIARNPASGSAWWTLADTQTSPFSEADIAAMDAVLATAGKTDRMYLHFALGRAWGERKNYARSFDNYARANAMKRLTIDYDADWLSEQIAACTRLYTREFFETRSGSGANSPAPIFVVGMQRAGSTLVEQILDSHPVIEATAELPDITLIAEQLAEATGPEKGLLYPDVLAMLDGAALRKLGERYLNTTRFRRKRGVPFFVDKNPYNFLHIGLIQLILPNAKIIDVRRHPLGCCWSNFSAHFETGALFAYRLAELGRAYADYVALMAHFDAVLPGRIVRVVYEDLVADPETQIRWLLDAVGLLFDDACLRFHENTRSMDSVSSEQVRRPLFRDSVDRWRDYEPWLGPLKAALGSALDAWRT